TDALRAQRPGPVPARAGVAAVAGGPAARVGVAAPAGGGPDAAAAGPVGGVPARVAAGGVAPPGPVPIAGASWGVWAVCGCEEVARHAASSGAIAASATPARSCRRVGLAQPPRLVASTASMTHSVARAHPPDKASQRRSAGGPRTNLVASVYI